MDIRQLPASVIMETTEYKCFQSQFSVLCNESMQLKTQFDDARQQWQSSKNSYLRDIEMMEIEELMAQEIKLRGECIQLEDVLGQLHKEYEKLQLVHRYKQKYKQASVKIPKLKNKIEELTTKFGQQREQENKEGNYSDGIVSKRNYRIFFQDHYRLN
ncbi:hypothetical protein PV328_008750 [Microctonus aethiopoides]|uniref:E3 ubiquitin protein ligase n=1 Tax=Microctonus aethiopoides TaxID=144406 RepID=A0AA39FK90_9HYME|nr:hypothetical protein PV328_008750 [Microctonus aethiopoides]